MSETLVVGEATDEVSPTPDLLVGELQAWLVSLAEVSPASADVSRIDRITAMEKLKGALAAAQARETVALKRSRLGDDAAAGVPVRARGRGVGAEVALARRESPHRGARLVGLADALVAEMPHTMAALTAGVISEWRATIMVRETACLTRGHRGEVDRRLADRLGSWSDRQLAAEAKRIGYTLDPASVVARASRSETDRRVTSRPVPDTMMAIRALLPMVQGAAVMAALTRATDTARAAGDPRTRGQLMADTLVERITGQTRADQTPVEVQLVITDHTLLGDSHTPGWLHGHGPMPAAYTRTLLRRLDDDTKTWLRRVFTDPQTGRITAVDEKKRLVTGPLRRAVIIRDQWCRTPWCGAPIRHVDHVIPVADGGESTEANTQGLCEACNHTKQAPGWRSTPAPDGGGGISVEITTPTGHTHTSRPPPLPGATEPDPPSEQATPPTPTTIEIWLRNPLDIEYAA